MGKMNQRSSSDIFRVGITVLATLYVVVRIFSVHLTCDEWGMLKSVIKPGMLDLLTFAYQDAQNHFLLGLLAIPFRLFVPIHEVSAIRLPSIIGFVMYLWAGYSLTGRLGKPYMRVIALLAWFGNPFLMDFFSLARGYGLEVGFEAVALLGVIRSFDKDLSSRRQSLWSHIAIGAAALACLATLSFIYVFVVVVGVLLLRRYLLSVEKKFGTRCMDALHNSGGVLSTLALVGVFYLPRVIVLVQKKKLYYGGTKGFFSDTVCSLVQDMFYGRVTSETLIASVAAVLCGLFLLNVVFFMVRRRTTVVEIAQLPAFLISVITLGSFAVIQLAHELADIKFVISRAALFFWPLLILQFCFMMDELRFAWLRWGNTVVLLFLFIPMVVAANLNQTYTWNFTANLKDVAKEMVNLSRKDNRPVVFGVSDPLKYTLWYYLKDECGLAESEKTINNPVYKQFGNVGIYSIDYGVKSGQPWLHHPQTTHYLLREKHQRELVSKRLSVREVAKMTPSSVGLYKVVEE